MDLDRPFVDRDLAAAVSKLVTSCTADATRLESEHRDPRQALPALVQHFGRNGLLRLVVPSAFGGAHDAVQSTVLCLAREQLGRVSPLADLTFAMQGLGSHPIVLRASEALKAQWLPSVANGTAIAAFALTETEAGSDLGRIATTARKDGDAYVLDGHKIFISNAGLASFYTVFAATAEMKAPRRLSAFVVPAGTAGLSATPMAVLGGHPIGEVTLQQVRVPIAARIGDEGDGMSIALETLQRFRPTVGAAAVGFAQRALDEALSHTTTREQFDGKLASLQAVQMRLADMAVDIDAARMLVYRAARAVDDNLDRAVVTRTGSIAKLFATEAAQRVIDHAVQLHGGRGVMTTSIVARLYEDVRALRIYEGTSDVQRLLIARTLTGL